MTPETTRAVGWLLVVLSFAAVIWSIALLLTLVMLAL